MYVLYINQISFNENCLGSFGLSDRWQFMEESDFLLSGKYLSVCCGHHFVVFQPVLTYCHTCMIHQELTRHSKRVRLIAWYGHSDGDLLGIGFFLTMVSGLPVYLLLLFVLSMSSHHLPHLYHTSINQEFDVDCGNAFTRVA